MTGPRRQKHLPLIYKTFVLKPVFVFYLIDGEKPLKTRTVLEYVLVIKNNGDWNGKRLEEHRAQLRVFSVMCEI